MPYRNFQQQRLAQGLCLRCGKRAHRPNRQQCAPCAKRKRVSAEDRRRERRARGLCMHCGVNPTTRSRCDECAERRNDLARSRTINPWLCKTCQKRWPAEGKLNCAECVAKSGRRARLAQYDLTDDDYARLLDMQMHLCAVCWQPFSSEHPPQIDHDHEVDDKREAVRGVVHARCNSLVSVVERGVWAGTGIRASGYDDLLRVGKYLARPRPFA